MTRDEVRALADMETHGINVAASTARDLARQLLEALDRGEAAETGRDTKAAARLGPVATVPECGDDAAPACPSCGVAYRDHLGLIGTCAALRAALDRAEAAEAERDRLRAVLSNLYAAAMTATDEYPEIETLRQQRAHHALIDVLYADDTAAALAEVPRG